MAKLKVPKAKCLCLFLLIIFLLLPGCRDPDIDGIFSKASFIHAAIKEVATLPEVRACISDRDWKILIKAEEQYVFARGLYEDKGIKDNRVLHLMVLSSEQVVLLLNDLNAVPAKYQSQVARIQVLLSIVNAYIRAVSDSPDVLPLPETIPKE